MYESSYCSFFRHEQLCNGCYKSNNRVVAASGGTAMRSGRGIDALSQDDRETLEWLAKHQDDQMAQLLKKLETSKESA